MDDRLTHVRTITKVGFVSCYGRITIGVSSYVQTATNEYLSDVGQRSAIKLVEDWCQLSRLQRHLMLAYCSCLRRSDSLQRCVLECVIVLRFRADEDVSNGHRGRGDTFEPSQGNDLTWTTVSYPIAPLFHTCQGLVEEQVGRWSAAPRGEQLRSRGQPHSRLVRSSTKALTHQQQA